MKKIKLWNKSKNLKIKLIVVKILSSLVKVYFKIFKHKDKYALYKWVLELGTTTEGKMIQGAITKFPEEFSHILNAPKYEKIDFKVKRGDKGYFIDLPFGNYYISDDDVKVVTVNPNNPISDREVLTKQEEEYGKEKAIL